MKIKIEEETTIKTTEAKVDKQKLIMTITMTKTLVFQQMKTIAMLLSDQINVGKTQYMLNILEKIGNRKPIHIRTRSPNQ